MIAEVDRDNNARAKVAAKVAGYQTRFRLENRTSRQKTRADQNGKGFQPRRAHKKSRMGCQNCKRRRIKCDETRERGCLNCRQHAIDCDYLLDADLGSAEVVCSWMTSSSRASSIGSDTPTTSTDVIIRPRVAHSICGMNDGFPEGVVPSLQTFRHFELFTSSTISSIAGQEIFKSSVLAIAQQEDFLKHALLGTAAAHLATLTPQDLQPVQFRRYARSAAYHWNLALPMYRKQLSHGIDAGTMDALITTCMLVGIYFFQANRVENNNSFVNVIPSQRQASLLWLMMQKGFSLLMQRLDQHIAASVWQVLFDTVSPMEEETVDLQVDDDEKYVLFLDLCEIGPYSTAQNNQYFSALQDLFALLRFDERSVTVFAQVVAFMGRVTGRFSELLLVRDSRASLILVYWLAMMYKLGLWWTRDRAAREGMAILEFLEHNKDARVLRLLQWPRRTFEAF